MQRTTAGALMTSALFLAGCGGSGAVAPHPANQTATASAARHYNSVADGVAAGVLKPVCGPVAPRRARCTSYVVVQSAAATAAQSAQRSASARNAAPDGYGPADLQSAYGLTAAARSKGNDALIAIVDAYDTPQAEHDLGVYRARYGLPPCTTANRCFRKVNQKGKTGPLPPVAPPDFAGWQVETALDLELVSANCPKCNILLVESNDDFMNNLGAAVNAAAEFEPAAISNSYVSNESATDPGPVAQDGLLAYYVHPNIAIVAGSGDFSYMSAPQWDGSVIGPLIPAAFPSVVAVGGTELRQDPTAARGWSESVWSSTGSGCSAFEPMPSWQRPDPNCIGSYTDAKGRTQTFPSRIYGDVAYAADNVAEYDSSGIFGSGGWHVLAGTSIGSPAIAAIYGLAGYGPDGKRDSDDGDFPARKLYTSRRGLFDVASGSNGACSDTYLCSAGPGYDGPTGNGSPNGIAAF
jgi:subtilase family serine protease